MALPKDSISRIRKEATKYCGSNRSIQLAYIAGGTDEAERSQKLAQALESICKTVLMAHEMEGNNPVANICRNEALQALAEYNSPNPVKQ